MTTTKLLSRPDRNFQIVYFADLTDLLHQISTTLPYFSLFLVLDATSVSNNDLRLLGRSLIDKGLSYLVVWGPDCERVHDQFDLERSPDEDDDHCIMTTWFGKDPLKEAIWYFVNVAYPSGVYQGKAEWIAASSAHAPWNGALESTLSALLTNSCDTYVKIKN